MALLNLKPSREVGAAMNFLMELRLDQGQIGEEKATAELLNWWEKQRNAVGALPLENRQR
jgi:poly(A) polymerase